MTRSKRVSFFALNAFALTCWLASGGCSSSNDPAQTSGGVNNKETGGSAGTGGSSGTGGAGTGGASGTGGAGTGGASGTGGAGTGGASGTGGAGTGGAGTGGASGTGGAGGTAPAGDGGGATSFTPLCAGLMASGAVPTKGGTCAAADPQLCYKTCGPESKGFKSETCSATTGTYAEQSGCTFPPTGDYACYKVPAADDASCPAEAISASTACTVAKCTVCGVKTGYLDSSGAPKTGYCVCPEASASGSRKWSCASATAWACPGNPGC